MLTLNDGRSELWQWDTGRTVSVDADCSQVHFSNKVFGRSIDVDVLDGVAIIPDVLLQTDKELIAWAFVGTPENGYTKISKVFKVNRRNKPSDYVFTPPEQTTLGEILERLDDLESVKVPDAVKNAVEDYLEQNPVEAPVQSVNGKTGTVELTSKDVGAISQDDLQEATNEALAKAKESGEFDGEPGRDYVLTDEDKEEIAELAAELVEIPDSGGNVAYDEEQELTEEQKAQARANIGAQPVGEYLTEVPEGYAKNEDIKKVDRKVDTLREVVSKFHRNIQETAKGEVITVSDASDLPMAGLKLFGKTEQNGTPTPEAPIPLESVGDDGSVAVTLCGKNLLKNTVTTQTVNGVTFTVNEDGSVIANGTANDTVYFQVGRVSYIGGVEYCVNGCVGGSAETYGIQANHTNLNGEPVGILDIGTGNAFVATKDETMPVFVFVGKGTNMNNVTFYPMIRFASIADATFEPYNAQTLTIPTHNGLPGIPVTRGGNYVASDGQQWICDEIDFARGKFVQRVHCMQVTECGGAYIVGAYARCQADSLYGNKTYSNKAMNTLFQYDPDYMGEFEHAYQWGKFIYWFLPIETVSTLAEANEWLSEHDLRFLYVLEKPIETDLTAEEIAQYSALHTNYPNTTIFNDGGAGMEVKYVADTKLYIDKKFAELSAALLNQ